MIIKFFKFLFLILIFPNILLAKSEYFTEDLIFKKDQVLNQNCLFSMTPYLYDEFCLIYDKYCNSENILYEDNNGFNILFTYISSNYVELVMKIFTSDLLTNKIFEKKNKK